MNAQTLFNNYIIAGVEASLARVRAAAYVVPEADRQQAWQILSFALKVDEAWPVTRELLLALAPKMEMAGFREEWIPYLEKGLQCAQRMGDENTVAGCKLHLGILHRLMSQFEKAFHLLTASANQYHINGDPQSEARALIEVSWLEHLMHQYQNATRSVEKALSLLSIDNHGKAMSYRTQGMIAFHTKNLQKAIECHRKALEIFTQLRDHRCAAWSLQNLAIALQHQSMFDEAFACYRKAIDALTKIGDISNLGIVHMNIGSAYYSAGASLQGIQHFTKSKEIAHRLDDKLQLARVNTHLGLAYLSIDDYMRAERAFQSSISYFYSLNDYSWQVNAMDGLVMTYLKNTQYNQAIEVAEHALRILSKIVYTPNYDYLYNSLTTHLEKARKDQADLTMIFRQS